MDIDSQRKMLLERREKLAGHLLKLEDRLDETPDKDWEDRSSERQGDEVLESLGHLELSELKRIDAALARVSNGSYGTCQKCRGAVSDARLKLLPDTPFCNQCA